MVYYSVKCRLPYLFPNSQNHLNACAPSTSLDIKFQLCKNVTYLRFINLNISNTKVNVLCLYFKKSDSDLCILYYENCKVKSPINITTVLLFSNNCKSYVLHVVKNCVQIFPKIYDFTIPGIGMYRKKHTGVGMYKYLHIKLKNDNHSNK